MSSTTYQMLAEKIQNTFYEGQPSDESQIDIRHFAQLAAEEVAAMATLNAITNSQQGETTFANDQFISTYTNQNTAYDSDLKYWYVPLPAQPASIPASSSIAIYPYGARKVQIVMMKNKDRFTQSFLEPIPCVILAFLENNRIYLDNPSAFGITAVNLKLVGAVPSGDLMSAPVNCPKNYEGIISENVIKRLMVNRPRDIVENKQGEQI